MRIECCMCGRTFNKRKYSDDDIMQDACKQCVAEMLWQGENDE